MLIAIIWLDHALFNPNQRCGMQAQDKLSAEAIFRDKVKFAYDNLPPELVARMPLQRDSESGLLFAHNNNSSARVATSMRSGMIHRLHISEFGKICAKYPNRVRESARYYNNLKEAYTHLNELEGRRRNSGSTSDSLKENPEARMISTAKRFEQPVSKLKKARWSLVERGADKTVVRSMDERLTEAMKKFNEIADRFRE